MQSAVVHRTQRLEISFSENDFEDWKKCNPDDKHTYENYVIHTATSTDDPSFWNTIEVDLVCIVYSEED